MLSRNPVSVFVICAVFIICSSSFAIFTSDIQGPGQAGLVISPEKSLTW
jgi:hypothetical protein